MREELQSLFLKNRESDEFALCLEIIFNSEDVALVLHCLAHKETPIYTLSLEDVMSRCVHRGYVEASPTGKVEDLSAVTARTVRRFPTIFPTKNVASSVCREWASWLSFSHTSIEGENILITLTGEGKEYVFEVPSEQLRAIHGLFLRGTNILPAEESV